jgi:hypothetical protein
MPPPPPPPARPGEMRHRKLQRPRHTGGLPPQEAADAAGNVWRLTLDPRGGAHLRSSEGDGGGDGGSGSDGGAVVVVVVVVVAVIVAA